MSSRLLASLLLLTCSSIAAYGEDAGGAQSVTDRFKKVSIVYARANAVTTFTATIPKGWSFLVDLDGNEDGKWGSGPVRSPIDSNTPHIEGPDVSYTVERDGAFCPQYIFGSDRKDEDQVAYRSYCKVFRSRATASYDGTTMLLSIPDSELFRDRQTARILYGVLDGKKVHRYFTLESPLVIAR